MNTWHQVTSGVRPKLLIVFLLAALVPLVGTGWVVSGWVRELVNESTRVHVSAVLAAKKSRVQHYFAQRREEMEMLTHSTQLLYTQRLQALETARVSYGEALPKQIQEWQRAAEQLVSTEPFPKNWLAIDWVFRQAGGGAETITGDKGERWRTLAAVIKPSLIQFQERYGFDNVYLLSMQGSVVLTAVAEPVLGESLHKEPFKNSGLEKLLSVVQEKSALQMFAPLRFLGNKPAALLGVPISSAKDGKTVGVLAVRFSPGVLKKTVGRNNEAGGGVNLYLVSPDRVRYAESGDTAKRQEVTTPEEAKPEEIVSLLGLLGSEAEGGGTTRSTSLSTAEEAATMPPAVLAAVTGGTGSGMVKGGNGRFVLASWSPLAIPLAAVTTGGTHRSWGIVAEWPVAQLFATEAQDGVPFYKKQMESSGYYDFFLIKPDGEIFFSATRQADYGTNMVDGPYANTNLGRLVRQVLEKRVFAMTDIAPYPPSNNEPAAFMAQPVLRNGAVELLVALQLPIEVLTTMMQSDDGLGSEGDAYLVGSDRLMRSDSLLDPKNQTVVAAFAGKSGKHDDSEAVREALAGKTGVVFGKSFAGTPVFMAFAPLTVANDHTWALLVTLPFVEGGVPLRIIPMTVWLTAAVTLLLGAMLVLAAANTIRRAVFQCAGRLQTLHTVQSLLAAREPVTTAYGGDELGLLAYEIQGVVAYWRPLIGKMRLVAGHISGCELELAKLRMVLPAAVDGGSDREGVGHTVVGGAAIEEVAVRLQQRVKYSQELEKWLVAVEHQALHGAVAIGGTVAAAREIVTKAADFGELARQINVLSMKATLDVASEGKYGKKFSGAITEIRTLAERGRIVADEISELAFGVVRSAENADAVLATFVPDMQKSVELARGLAAVDVDQHGELVREVVRMHTVAQQLRECAQNNNAVVNHIWPILQAVTQKVALLRRDLAGVMLGDEVIDAMSAQERDRVLAAEAWEE